MGHHMSYRINTCITFRAHKTHFVPPGPSSSQRQPVLQPDAHLEEVVLDGARRSRSPFIVKLTGTAACSSIIAAYASTVVGHKRAASACRTSASLALAMRPR